MINTSSCHSQRLIASFQSVALVLMQCSFCFLPRLRCSHQRSALRNPKAQCKLDLIIMDRPEIKRFLSIGLFKCVTGHLLQPVPAHHGPSNRWRVLVLLRRHVAVSVVADVCRCWKRRIQVPQRSVRSVPVPSRDGPVPLALDRTVDAHVHRERHLT